MISSRYLMISMCSLSLYLCAAIRCNAIMGVSGGGGVDGIFCILYKNNTCLLVI